jgi:hypothetical protein
VLRPLVEERLRHHVDRLVEAAPAAVERDAQGLELALEVAGPDPEDGAPARERVEGEERLGGGERVAVPGNVDVGEEPDALGHAGQEAEGRDSVPPDGRHRRRLRARHADVVADGDVEEARPVARSGDLRQLGRPRVLLPRLHEHRALRDDRELEPVGEPLRRADRDGGHRAAFSRMRVVECTGSRSKRGIT